jgi:hypothetical protein
MRTGQEVFCWVITVPSLVGFTRRGRDAVGGGCAGDDVHVESAAAADYPRSDAGCGPQRSQGIQVPDTDGGDHVDSRRQQVLDVLPSGAVARAGRVAVREIVYQRHRGAAQVVPAPGA